MRRPLSRFPQMDGDCTRHAAGSRMALGRCVPGAHLARAVEHARLDDGRLVLVMVLADGGSLRDVVAIRGAVPLGEVVTALTPMATALAELDDGRRGARLRGARQCALHDRRPADARRPVVGLARGRRVAGRDPGHAGVHRPGGGAGPPPGARQRRLVARSLVWYARTGGSTPPAWLGDLHWRRGVTTAGDLDDELDSEAPTGTPEDITTAVGLELRSLGDPDARRATRRPAVGGRGGPGAVPGSDARAGGSRRAPPRPGGRHHHEDPA